MSGREPGAAPPGDGAPPVGPGRRRRPARMRTLYLRVIVVQTLTLLGLWLLERTFGP